MTTFEKFCLSAWLKLIATVVCAILAGCNVAQAQQRGGMVTISPDGSVAATAPVVRQAVRYGYPVRGSHWTYPGHSRQELIHHLLTDGIHRGRFSRNYLESLSYEELRSAHDDHHEGRLQTRYIATGAVAFSGYRQVAVPLSSGTSRAIDRAERKAAKDLGRAVFGTRDGRHPGPVGGWIRGLFGDPRYRSYGGCPGGRCPGQ